MDTHKLIVRETLIVAACEAIVAAATIVVYALIKKLSAGAFVGAISGALLAVINYLIMAYAANRISVSAVKDEEAKSKSQGLMRTSYIIRLLLIFGVLAALTATKLAEPIALIVPLILMQPIIIFTQYLSQRKVK